MNEPKEKASDFINPKWKLNIVFDEKHPELYSRQVINIFSLLFSVFFWWSFVGDQSKKNKQ